MSNLEVLSENSVLGSGLGREARIMGREKWGNGEGGKRREGEDRGLENEGRWRLSGGMWEAVGFVAVELIGIMALGFREIEKSEL